jgi:hypothetical protein
MDVKNVFLNGDLSEEVYMQPPPGLSHPTNKACRLHRTLYGLKQAPRAWFAKFSAIVSSFGYSIGSYNSALFIRRTDQRTILLLLYVDDMIITGDDVTSIQELKQFLNQHFEMKDLGPLSYFLVLDISSSSSDGYYLTQAKYISLICFPGPISQTIRLLTHQLSSILVSLLIMASLFMILPYIGI